MRSIVFGSPSAVNYRFLFACKFGLGSRMLPKEHQKPCEQIGQRFYNVNRCFAAVPQFISELGADKTAAQNNNMAGPAGNVAQSRHG